MAKDYSDDGIEIHWDERNGHLSLACGQEAFARFREVVREELGDLPEIPVDQVVIVEISDTRKIVDRRESPRNLALSALLVIGLFAILFPWGAGIAIILKWATR